MELEPHLSMLNLTVEDPFHRSCRQPTPLSFKRKSCLILRDDRTAFDLQVPWIEKCASAYPVLREMIPEGNDYGEPKLGRVCWDMVLRDAVAQFIVTNGFTYPVKPASLPRLNEVEECMMSPRIPFGESPAISPMVLDNLGYGNK
ncbi:hypothetical protein MTO96_007867 [Rhipicephalus appendiculatus]